MILSPPVGLEREWEELRDSPVPHMLYRVHGTMGLDPIRSYWSLRCVFSVLSCPVLCSFVLPCPIIFYYVFVLSSHVSTCSVPSEHAPFCLHLSYLVLFCPVLSSFFCGDVQYSILACRTCDCLRSYTRQSQVVAELPTISTLLVLT